MKEAKTPYISPDIEVIQFKTEKGFAASGGAQGWERDGEQNW
jgi:hypothetical protein